MKDIDTSQWAMVRDKKHEKKNVIELLTRHEPLMVTIHDVRWMEENKHIKTHLCGRRTRVKSGLKGGRCRVGVQVGFRLNGCSCGGSRVARGIGHMIGGQRLGNGLQGGSHCGRHDDVSGGKYDFKHNHKHERF